ncbi:MULTISPECIES: SDR family oxidoreductase [Kitasatospora]|uniref:SDR family oxidoreductase n=1 Tax=Kitasatospora TaxID=2063 RepID=UPI0004C2CA13|nr:MULTISPECIES: SDR family oxidoreductase [unclassified Kitasatospora]WAL73202.1 SDR family oxidoreductase [Kitasatospora sp. YST-16]WNW39255.1 SDR family oxidoreductase [Streptomyces sp. Li-HN-5-13]
MDVVIAGGHGKIALRLSKLLSERGDAVAGLIRNPAQAGDLAEAGARAVVCDLERVSAEELAGHLAGADAVVFAAGAGPGSGAARKETVDRDGAVLLAEAARRAGVRRYLLVSSMGLDRIGDPEVTPEFDAYLRAKQAAEEAVKERPLDWTVLRPGGLTDTPTERHAHLAPPPNRFGQVSRDEVAHTLVRLLDDPSTVHQTLELTT